jgi:hypothetical protein
MGFVVSWKMSGLFQTEVKRFFVARKRLMKKDVKIWVRQILRVAKNSDPLIQG